MKTYHIPLNYFVGRDESGETICKTYLSGVKDDPSHKFCEVDDAIALYMARLIKKPVYSYDSKLYNNKKNKYNYEQLPVIPMTYFENNGKKITNLYVKNDSIHKEMSEFIDVCQITKEGKFCEVDEVIYDSNNKPVNWGFRNLKVHYLYFRNKTKKRIAHEKKQKEFNKMIEEGKKKRKQKSPSRTPSPTYYTPNIPKSLPLPLPPMQQFPQYQYQQQQPQFSYDSFGNEYYLNQYGQALYTGMIQQPYYQPIYGGGKSFDLEKKLKDKKYINLTKSKFLKYDAVLDGVNFLKGLNTIGDSSTFKSHIEAVITHLDKFEKKKNRKLLMILRLLPSEYKKDSVTVHDNDVQLENLKKNIPDFNKIIVGLATMDILCIHSNVNIKLDENQLPKHYRIKKTILKAGKRKKSKKSKIRKHRGINQKTGRLNKGYKYSGKELKSGIKQIIKSKK